jgi:hypothetical protein
VTGRRGNTLTQLEKLAWDETMRGRACHIDAGDPTRYVLRSGARVLAWAPKTKVPA